MFRKVVNRIRGIMVALKNSPGNHSATTDEPRRRQDPGERGRRNAGLIFVTKPHQGNERRQKERTMDGRYEKMEGRKEWKVRKYGKYDDMEGTTTR